MEIKLFTDVVCPYCYIAEKKLTPYLKNNFRVSFIILGMELHPETPAGGVDITHERYQPFRTHVEKFARAFNMDDLRIPERSYNTRKLLLLAESAREQGRLNRFWQQALDAYWQDQAALDDDTVLKQLAQVSGLAPGSTASALNNMEFALRLDKRRYNALRLGVHTLPAFMWGTQAVLGCQPPEVFHKALSGLER